MRNFLFLLFVIFKVKAAAKEKKRRYQLFTFHYYHYDYHYQELNNWSWWLCLVPVWMSSCVYVYAGLATATSPVIQCCCDSILQLAVGPLPPRLHTVMQTQLLQPTVNRGLQLVLTYFWPFLTIWSFKDGNI